MPFPLFIIDAFTAVPFAGNPAGVCLLSGPADAVWMQNLAREMNLSEAAFLHAEGDAYRLRWFTPAVEVDLCGHATLASAHVLWEHGRLPLNDSARFLTRGGLLIAERRGDAIELDFPAKPAEACSAPDGLAEALGAPRFVGRSQFDYLVELESEAAVRAVKPDFVRLGVLPVRGVSVTAASAAPAFDFVSRFFAPAVGVNEDPVTGSAHCCLAPFWRERLGKEEMTAFQASARGGVVWVRAAGTRVQLRGQAVTVLRGELLT